jgi:hypothetical protein
MLRPSPLISEPENQQGSSINDGDQVYQVEWSWSLWFGLYPAYKVFQPSNATTLTFDLRPWKSIGFFH